MRINHLITVRNYYQIIVLMIFSFSICISSQDIGGNEFGKPFINYYSPKVYKSNARNWNIIQDSRGVMYFANESGVLEYDGHFWRKIRVPQDKMVRSIAIDKSDKIYVCADIDFGYLEPDIKGALQYVSLLPYLDEKDRNTGEVSDVKTLGNKAYFKTRDKIFKWDGSKITVWDSVFSFHSNKLKNKIYTWNDGKGLMVIEDDELKLIPNWDLIESLSIIDMIPYGTSKVGKDSILITTYDQGLFIYDFKNITKFKTDADQYLIENHINDATLSSDSNYVFTTQLGGIIIIKPSGKIVKIIDENSGLQTNVCFNVFCDKNGSLWVTTEYGIYHIKEPSSLSSFHNSGELKNVSNSIYRFKNRIYAATELGPMIFKNSEEGFQPLKGENQPASVFTEFNNELLVGTSLGAFVIKNNIIRKRILDDVTTCFLVSDYFPNRLYVGTYNGFSVIENIGSEFKLVYEKELPDEVINIIEESDGSLWINGFFAGLISVSGNLNELSSSKDNNIKYKHYINSNKLSGNLSGITKINSECLFLTDNGIYKFDKKVNEFIKYSSLNDNLSNVSSDVYLIAPGNNSSIYIMSYLDDELSLGVALLKNDGTYNWELIPELSSLDLYAVLSIYPDIDPLTGNEKLWMSSEDGLVLYDPTIKTNSLNNYSTLIRKIDVNRDSTIYYGANTPEFYDDIEIDYSDNDIKFEYAATHYDKPNSTLFKTLLIGDEDEWSDWSLENKKEYTNLAHGDYKFNVIAKNIYGIESDVGSYNFTILAPWYMSWWSYIIYLSIIGGTLFSVRKFELNRKEKNNKIRMSELKAEAAEFQAKAAETQAQLMQADNDRKTKELEEARQLQLSMLPKDLPDIEKLDMAVYMKTATEVGGDYYDFSTKNDNSINVCLGDATGHGMKAGTLVSMMKSLFLVNSGDKSIGDFFTTSNEVLKNARLDRMMIAFTMANINGNYIQISNAGNPPVFIFRNQKSKIEEVKVNGLPFGAMKNIEYKIYESYLSKGDVILMLSDGFPELQNEENEMYGYERIISLFENSVDKTSEEIITILKNSGKEWINEKDPDDDVTFIVIKVK